MKTRIASEPGLSLITAGVANSREETGRMQPAHQQGQSRKGLGRGWGAGDVTLSAALAGDVAVGVKSPVGSLGGASVDVVPSAIAGVASPADCVGVASSTDSVGFVDLPKNVCI